METRNEKNKIDTQILSETKFIPRHYSHLVFYTNTFLRYQQTLSQVPFSSFVVGIVFHPTI